MTFLNQSQPATGFWNWLPRLRLLNRATTRRRAADLDLAALSPHLQRDLGFVDAGPFHRPMI